MAMLMSLALSQRALGYVDLAPTLAKIITDSKTISVVEVAEFNRQAHTVVLKKIRDLKGELPADLIRQDVAPDEGAVVPRQIMQWAEPGARGVIFSSRNSSLVCVGQGWYQVRAGAEGQWKLGADRPDLPLAYYGAVTRLADSVEQILAGKETVLTVVAHGGSENEAASFDLALNRQSLPGLARVERIRANAKMPAMVMAASANPAYLMGPGPVDIDELPVLIEKLKSADAIVRAEAADDLRWLGKGAQSATEPLTRLLDDASPQVRLSAAAALLRINPNQTRPTSVLEKGMESSDAGLRRDAARLSGYGGTAAKPLVGKLAQLLSDESEATRVAVVQSIALLGPVAAAASDSVKKLLDEPALQIDAADALGRIGIAARPVTKSLVTMLESDEPTIHWAAVRAMSQMGGPEAHPAVDFIIKNLPNSTEIDGYNMMIYLSLLGPVAKDAIPTVQNARIKNPVLPSSTLWAIQADTYFPWQSGGGFGGWGGGRGFGGPGGGPGGGGADISTLIYESYIHELGERLHPAAVILAKKIMDGSAGDVPDWGYKMLACGSDETASLLAHSLADRNIVTRERAAVAIGYMGSAAESVKPQLQDALGKAPTERERKLLQWSLGEIERN